MESDVVFSWAAVTEPTFKLALILVVVMALMLCLFFSKQSPAMKVAAGLTVPVLAVVVAGNEYRHTEPGYARIQGEIEAGRVRETSGRFQRQSGAHFTVGEQTFDAGPAHFPALVLTRREMRALTGACVNVRYTTAGDIVWLSLSGRGDLSAACAAETTERVYLEK